MKNIKLPVLSVEKTGKRIHELRMNNRIKVKELQAILGVSHTAIYNWESGKGTPSLDNLVILAELFNVTINDIVQLEENK